MNTSTADLLVVNASVFLKWYLRDEELLEEADRLLDDWTAGHVAVVEPSHLPYEFTAAIIRATRRGRLSEAEANQAIIDFTDLLPRMAFAPPQPVVRGGVRLAAELGVNFFDACYLQAARMDGIPLLTADEAFYRQTAREPDVRWLGDYTRTAQAPSSDASDDPHLQAP